MCRHQVPLAAVNLIKSGERYAYSHYLLTSSVLPKFPPRFLSQDIACKHQPWRQKAEARLLSNPATRDTAAAQRVQSTRAGAAQLVDVLPEAHGIVHAFACQVCRRT